MRIHHLLLLCLAAWFGSVLGQTRITTLHHLQTADFLYNKQYQIKLNSNVFDAYNRPNDTIHHGYKLGLVGEAYVGITDRIVFGVQSGWEPSISIKAKVLTERGEYIPTLAIAAHSVLASPEASFYRVLDEDTINGLKNAVSLVAAKSFKPISTRFQIGLQSLPLWKTENYTPFFGFEHYFGAGWYASAETFRRFELFHTNLSFSWRHEERFLVTVGFSEVREFLYNEKGEFGFYATGHKTMPTGYNSPGIHVSFCWNGNLGASGEGISSLEDEIRLLNSRLDKLNSELMRVRETLKSESARSASLQQTLDKASAEDKNKTKFRTRGGKSVAWFSVENLLKQIQQALSSEMPYDPSEVMELRKKIQAMGADALPALKASALDRTADPRLRTAAVNILAEIEKAKDPDTEELLVVLLAEPVLELRIEALLALGKHGMTGAIQEIELLTNDPDETVSSTARSVLKQLKK